VLAVTRAPTMFGPVSFRVESRLSNGELRLEITSPPHRPALFLVRPPLPRGWKAAAASVPGRDLPVRPDGAIDLTGQTGTLRVRVQVVRPQR
jgi:hypothetical protein